MTIWILCNFFRSIFSLHTVTKSSQLNSSHSYGGLLYVSLVDLNAAIFSVVDVNWNTQLYVVRTIIRIFLEFSYCTRAWEWEMEANRSGLFPGRNHWLECVIITYLRFLFLFIKQPPDSIELSMRTFYWISISPPKLSFHWIIADFCENWKLVLSVELLPNQRLRVK